jgi:hypothetical protein
MSRRQNDVTLSINNLIIIIIIIMFKILNLDFLTMQTFIDKNNDEYVKNVSSNELTRRVVNITTNAKFN